eukprot:m.1090897 g.1090897  ORF g.1090897 m.1090897 type:complete len:81 (-) comp24286_c1_seq120:3969-4211(-)
MWVSAQIVGAYTRNGCVDMRDIQGCSHVYEYPAEQFNADYGEPLGLCHETAPDSGVFVREWTHATVQMDCNTWTPKITFK